MVDCSVRRVKANEVPRCGNAGWYRGQLSLLIINLIVRSFFCVSGMTHILSVKVRPRVFVAKCSKPQAEGREAGVKEAV